MQIYVPCDSTAVCERRGHQRASPVSSNSTAVAFETDRVVRSIHAAVVRGVDVTDTKGNRRSSAGVAMVEGI